MQSHTQPPYSHDTLTQMRTAGHMYATSIFHIGVNGKRGPLGYGTVKVSMIYRMTML